MIKQNKLQQVVADELSRVPLHILATKIGVSPSTLMKIKTEGYRPKQGRLVNALMRYFSKHDSL